MLDRLSVLLLCDDGKWHANTIRDHIAAFRRWSRHRISVLNPCGLERCRALDLDQFDVVVLHYSVFVISDHHLAPTLREKIERFQGLKAQFIQDEYRRVDEIAAMMRRLGIRLLFTVVPKEEQPKIWNEARLPGVVKVSTLTGYVPDELANRSSPSLAERAIDIGYRGRDVPWWLGELGQEKVTIGEGVLARADRYGLRCDIAWTESSRIYGEQWIRFISSCKAVLGTESGASITDFDGSLEKRVARYRSEHPSAGFSEVHREVLASFEGNARVIAISPRMFEAAALRTAMVLFPGDYSGILKQWTHYIPLEKDFSNMDEVVERLRDREYLHELVERAHADLVASGRYSYETFVHEFDDILDANAWRHGGGGRARFRLAQAEVFVRKELLWILDLWRPMLLLLKVMVRNAGLRTIFLDYFRHKRLRLTPAPELIVDLLRFDALARHAHAGFEVVAVVDAEQGRLGFASRPVTDEDSAALSASGHLRELVEPLVTEGRLTAITWDNALLIESLRRRGASTVGLGSEGSHRFRALERLAGTSPERLWSILRPVLAGATISGP